MAHPELNPRARRVIEEMLNAKMSVREIKRNHSRDEDIRQLNGYHAVPKWPKSAHNCTPASIVDEADEHTCTKTVQRRRMRI